MGFITSWLKEDVLKNQPHTPREADAIEFKYPSDEDVWLKDRGVVFTIQVLRMNDKAAYSSKFVHLTGEEAKDALSNLIAIVEPDELEPLVIKALSLQSDESLLGLLRTVLGQREERRRAAIPPLPVAASEEDVAIFLRDVK